MGRRKEWLQRDYEVWRALRTEASFAALELLGGKGLDKVDQSELQPIIERSPALTAATSLAAIKTVIIDAAKGLANDRRRDALLVLLRATDESMNLATESVHRLARVKLGEADPHVVTLGRKLGATPSALALIQTIPQDNSNFRRAPNPKRKPGEYFFLLRELYRELVPTGASRSPIDERGQPGKQETQDTTLSTMTRVAASETNMNAVREAIRRHYGTELELTQMARVLLTDLDVIEKLKIDITLTDDGQDWFRFNVVREFQARFMEYTIGVVLGDDTRAALSRRIPELKDVIWLPPQTPNIDVVAGEMVNDGLLEGADRRAKGGFRPLQFQPLPSDHEFFSRMAEERDISKGSYRLLTIDRASNGSEAVHYRSTLHMPLHRSRRRCAWFADGPTFIDSITIDLSNFSDALNSAHANVYFMLPGTNSYSDEAERSGKVFKRIVCDWVVRHHGFIIHW